jgi:galactose-1-phosphate uridylyltransferase
MIKELADYLRGVKEVDLKKLEKIVQSPVLDPKGEQISFDISIRENPAFLSKARIDPKREMRKLEITADLKPKVLSDECMFCDPEKCAKFSPELGLEKQYFLNDSMSFSNWFTSSKFHGVIVYNYKQHVIDPRQLTLENWIDGISLVKKIGKLAKKKYVSSHINYGLKAAASLEHFHGQFHCEDEPIAMTKLSMQLTKNDKWWKSWVKALNNEGLVIDYDADSKTVLFVEWSPAFGKVELVIMNLENPCFFMNDKETEAVARFMQRSVDIVSEISDQFNVINLSASAKDSYCNQFRIIPRSPTSQSLKTWEGYLEFLGETVPHIRPKKVAELASQIGSSCKL